MSAFDPGDGWRRLDPYEETHRPKQRTLTEHDENGAFVAYWVREELVPALPTDPGYYVSGDGGEYPGGVYRLDEDSDGLIWDDTYGNPHTDDQIRRALPLSLLQPRAVTAKAVLDRVRASELRDELVLDLIAREFGVKS